MKRLSAIFRNARVVALTLLLAFVAIRAWDPAPLETLRMKTFDLYQIAKPRIPKDYPVAIIDIDERSLREIGQWPWPRSVLADLVNRTAELGVRGIAFDVLFAEADRLSPDVLTKQLDFLPLESREALKDLPSNDRRFAKSFEALPVVLGQVGTISRDAGGPRDQPQAVSPQVSFIGGDPRPYLFNVPGLVRNLETLEASADGHGLFSIRPEADGIIRRVATVMQADGQALPSLAVELLRVTSNGSATLVRRNELGVRDVAVAGTRFPTDRNGQVWLHFGPRDENRYVSAADVINGTVDPSRLSGKLAILGTSAAGLFDLRATPLDRVMPGAEIHAQKIENILSGELLRRPSFIVGAEVLLAIVAGGLIIILAPMLGALPILLLGAAVAVAYLGTAWYLFDQHRILLDAAYPLISSFAVFLAITFMNYLREEEQRAQIRSAFGQYLSPALVEQLTSDPDRLKLGGETRELTILFSDVRGFTAIAESYRDSPGQLTRLMNRLLTPLSNAIIERNGTIDKYMGDAVMAFWNAPLDDADHGYNACDAALVMVARMRELNKHLREEAKEAGRTHTPLEVGIGVATGPAMVGNMGSEIRFDYSVLGDRVNLASRLEGLTRQLGVAILLADDTARRVQGRLATLQIDLVRVKGKSEAEPVHALLGDTAMAQSSGFAAFRDKFAAFRTAYIQQDFSTCETQMPALIEEADSYGLGALLELYGARIAALRGRPLDPTWTGIFDAVEK